MMSFLSGIWRQAICALTVVAAIAFADSTSASPYRLDVGDVLELSIFGEEDGKYTVSVELDGEASFPLIGPVQVAGLTLSEVRSRIRTLVSQQVLRTRNGAEVAGSIEPHEVALRIVAYRPVYINGDVAKTGEIPFRPGLTVEQAVSIAGGYDILRSQAASSLVQSLELKNEHDRLALELSSQQARVWRLETALDRNAPPLDRRTFPQISDEALSEIIKIEDNILKVEREDFQNQRGFLVTAIQTAEERITTLLKLSKNEEEGSKIDEEEARRVIELGRKGIVPISRVTEVRRAALLSSSRALQTGVAAENAKKDLEELKSKLQKLQDTRHLSLLQDLEEASSKIRILQSQLKSVRENVAVAAASRPDFLRAPGSKLAIWISRGSADGPKRLAGDEHTQLHPGDVVEVSLRIELSEELKASSAASPLPMVLR